MFKGTVTDGGSFVFNSSFPSHLKKLIKENHENSRNPSHNYAGRRLAGKTAKSIGFMKSNQARLRTFAYGIVSFIGLVYVMDLGSFILVPLVWAIFFAFALMPMTTWFENKRIPRLISIVFSMLIITLGAALVVYLFIIQLSSLLTDAPQMTGKIQDFIQQLENIIYKQFGLPHVFRNLSLDVSAYINGSNLSDVLKFTTTTITTITLLPVFIFLFLYYQDFFREFIHRLATTHDVGLQGWLHEAIKVVRKYLTGMLMVTIILSIVGSVIFYLLGIKYYILFGLFTAFCNLIPYVGVIFGSLVTIFYVLISTDNIGYPLVTLFLLWLMQVLENNFITPVIVGAKIKLNPLAVILAIILGGGVWGVSGMILFIPLLGIVKIVLDKSNSLRPYSYLLGDDIPIHEPKENIFLYIKHRFKREPDGSTTA